MWFNFSYKKCKICIKYKHKDEIIIITDAIMNPFRICTDCACEISTMLYDKKNIPLTKMAPKLASKLVNIKTVINDAGDNNCDEHGHMVALHLMAELNKIIYAANIKVIDPDNLL